MHPLTEFAVMFCGGWLLTFAIAGAIWLLDYLAHRCVIDPLRRKLT